MIKNSKNRGFTLLELILYVAIISVVLLTVAVFLNLILSSRVKNQSISEVGQQGDYVMQIITQAVRNSSGINSPAAGVSSSTLSLASATPAKNPTVLSLSGNSLYIQEGSASAVVLTSPQVAVSGLSFQNLAITGTKGTIKIQMGITFINSSGRNEYNATENFEAAASLR